MIRHGAVELELALRYAADLVNDIVAGGSDAAFKLVGTGQDALDGLSRACL